MVAGLEPLPDDASALKAIIAAKNEEIARLAAAERAYEALVQALRIRIERLRKQKCGSSAEKIEREIEQLELALEDLEVAMGAADTAPEPEENETQEEAPFRSRRRGKLRVSETTPRERIVLDPGDTCPECGGPLRPIGEDVAESSTSLTPS